MQKRKLTSNDITDAMVKLAACPKETRYIHKEVPISKRDAVKARKQIVDALKFEIESLHKEIEDIKSSRLPTTRIEMFRVLPGEPGYEKAHYGLEERMLEKSPWIGLLENAET